MYALKNCTIFTGEGVLENSAVIVDGRRITEIIAVSDVAKGMEVRDLKGSILAPGFIDLQLNGCGGRMFNDDISVETLDVMAEAILPTGCTSFYRRWSAPMTRPCCRLSRWSGTIGQGMEVRFSGCIWRGRISASNGVESMTRTRFVILMNACWKSLSNTGRRSRVYAPWHRRP